MSSVLKYTRYIFASGFMFGSAPTFFVVWTGWRGISLLLPKWLFQKIDDDLFGAYQKLVLFFYEHITGLKIYFSGDLECFKKEESILYFSNHQSTVDWVICNAVAIRQKSIGHLRYVMKYSLQALPLYGFYFYEHGCIYVKRGSFKPRKMLQALDYLKHPKIKSWIVVFPEGTRFVPNHPAIEKSKKAAEDADLPVLRNLLTPRHKGSWLIFESMQHSLDAVYNVTCIYGSTIQKNGRQKAPQLDGRCKEVHINVKRVPIHDVPVNEDEFRKWLHMLYYENDKLLDSFYNLTDPLPITAGGKQLKLRISETLPSFVFFASLLIPLGFSSWWRTLYLKTCALGTLGGYVWLAIRSVA
ncbi:1-acyl-sn-glycerol-3-phosphate acyltransferase epsilon-like isoform X2 [Artemia franciscana]|uniref:Phospholipid/glycerol acyltransferase domain-containing protein n=1 Tax=Artemia franciscana TaxID=6661 RepID=A0AA88I7U1_ARTSF|nr:hypothetical protein QYM36_002463 [Artemia franciscana]